MGTATPHQQSGRAHQGCRAGRTAAGRTPRACTRGDGQGSCRAGCHPAAKVANSDAKALARYLSAAGLDVTPDRLNDLLVLLAVVMVEVGGGLSLAVGMALSGPTREATAASPDTRTQCPFGPNSTVRQCPVRCLALPQLRPPTWRCGCANRVGGLRLRCVVWRPPSGVHSPACMRSCVVWWRPG
jgi:hypothetical protein